VESRYSSKTTRFQGVSRLRTDFSKAVMSLCGRPYVAILANSSQENIKGNGMEICTCLTCNGLYGQRSRSGGVWNSLSHQSCSDSSPWGATDQARVSCLHMTTQSDHSVPPEFYKSYIILSRICLGYRIKPGPPWKKSGGRFPPV
jgi:hypothetical protein